MALRNILNICLRNSRSITPNFVLNSPRCLSTTVPEPAKKEVTVTFVKQNGDRIKTKAKVGDSLLDVVLNNNVDIDGFGACEGTLTCSTCHLVFKKEDFDRIEDKQTDEELDMLDLAYELCDTSRLGCQIHVKPDFDGIEIKVPAGINDARNN